MFPKKISKDIENTYDVLMKLIFKVYENDFVGTDTDKKLLDCCFQQSLEILDGGVMTKIELTRLLQYIALIEKFIVKHHEELIYQTEKYARRLLDLTITLVDKKKMELKIKI